MKNLIQKFREIPESKKIIVYGKLAFFKNLFYFLFKVIVGIVFRSWFLIAIAIYSLFIGYVKDNCSRGLLKNKDNKKDIHSYIRGGVVLSVSSIFYIIYTIFQIYYPSNFQYNLIIAIAIAAFATYSIAMSIVGIVRAKGKSMLIKEYKFTNFATAFNNIVLTQITLLSVASTSENIAVFNGIIGVIVGILILGIGLYLTIDGLIKKHKYYEIVKRHPDILKYINPVTQVQNKTDILF